MSALSVRDAFDPAIRLSIGDARVRDVGCAS